ncbi:cytochrome c [Hymenobacter sp. BT175]|uniref:c-type cytochrome n=1 Tax=Hymenobacter translucens TaxID=2886507 RepID=UPI001D0F4650|nr:cytochrome c [Hymenobacter translucens]MCC2546363.1 cytochrome c [Hymenobacter translucens]
MSRLLRLAGALAFLLILAGCFTERQNEGHRLYDANCSNCHGESGEGLRQLIPPLAGSDYLKVNRAALACLLRKGANGPMTVNGKLYQQVMPGNATLTDAEITNLLNYVQTSWGNSNEVFTIREVTEQLTGCGGSIVR